MGLTTDIGKLKVPDLKKELKQRGLNTTGNKNELVERLQEALKSPGVSTEMSSGSLESDFLEDDLLNDDDDEPQSTSETVLDADVDQVLEETTLTTQNLKRLSPPLESTNGVEKKSKKIKLQRDVPVMEEISSSKVDKTVEKSDSDTSLEPKSKVIKLSGISVKERLELRAKKFGVKLTGSAKLLARAERFGSLESEPKLNEMEKLKRRAERFGGGSITKEVTPTSQEMKDKLEARKARFASGK